MGEEIKSKFIRINFWPIFTVLLSLELIVLILLMTHSFASSVSNDRVLGETIFLAGEGLITLIAAGVGIFTPLFREEKKKEAEDKRKRGFMYGLLWSELRRNRQVLRHLLSNFRNIEGAFTIEDFEKFIGVLSNKFLALSRITFKLSDRSFISAQNSGSVTTINKDHVFNEVVSVYGTISDLKVLIISIAESFRIKSYITSRHFTMVQDLYPLQGEQRQTVESDIITGEQRLQSVISKVDEVIELLNSELTELGISEESFN